LAWHPPCWFRSATRPLGTGAYNAWLGNPVPDGQRMSEHAVKMAGMAPYGKTNVPRKLLGTG